MSQRLRGTSGWGQATPPIKSHCSWHVYRKSVTCKHVYRKSVDWTVNVTRRWVAYLVKVCWKSTYKTHQSWKTNIYPWGDYSFVISFLSMTYVISFGIHPDFSNLFGVRADYNLLEGKWVGRIYSLVVERNITYMDIHSFISIPWGLKEELKTMFGKH